MASHPPQPAPQPQQQPQQRPPRSGDKASQPWHWIKSNSINGFAQYVADRKVLCQLVIRHNPMAAAHGEVTTTWHTIHDQFCAYLHRTNDTRRNPAIRTMQIYLQQMINQFKVVLAHQERQPKRTCHIMSYHVMSCTVCRH
jgi:hypothetical protein